MIDIQLKDQKVLSRVVMILGILSLLFAVQDVAIAAEAVDITGTITARREGAVKVEFKPHPKAGPKVGDTVDFKTMMQGFEAKAGKGEVTQVESSHVWVKVLEKKPKLKMTGIIHATGESAGRTTGKKASPPAVGSMQAEKPRAWLGVMFQKATPELVRFLRLRDDKGVLVNEVLPEGPAAKGGIKRKDVIVRFDNKEVVEMAALPRIVAQTPIGSTVNVDIIRDGIDKTLQVTIEDFRVKIEDFRNAKPPIQMEGNLGLELKFPGLQVKHITPEIMQTLRLDSANGVLVSNVKPDGSAAKAGIRKGDVILKIGQEPVNTVGNYTRALLFRDKHKAPLFLIRRGGATLKFYVVNVKQ
jgi:C-terminal processing protease CtpA/Prc